MRRICLNRSGSPSGMRAEHLCQWLIAATQDDTLDATNWQKVASIVQTSFCYGKMAEELMWQMVVLIPKGQRGDFRGIGLVEVIWKTMSSLLKRRLTAAIMFHDMLHCFRVGHGMVTATLEAKLPQKLTSMREAVLFEVFLDLQKA